MMFRNWFASYRKPEVIAVAKKDSPRPLAVPPSVPRKRRKVGVVMVGGKMVARPK